MRYPMQLSPVCKSTIWGGNRMRDVFGFQTKLDNIAEAWMLSAREDAPGFIVNGEYFGEMLHAVLEKNPELLSASNDKECPLLIKFIDARDKLSVQVHPDDTYAAAKGIGRGKTEMWVILDAARGAELLYGTKEDFSADMLRAAIENGTLSDMLRHVPVQAGDVFYIPAGMIHAIGSGILLAEIQQNCDTTYRVYDYDRRQADGSFRALHIDDAVACAKHFTEAALDALRYENGDRDALADAKYFHVESHAVQAPQTFSVGDVFVSLLVTSGCGDLLWQGERYAMTAGMSYFLPAGLGDYTISSGTQDAAVKVLLSRPAVKW